MSHEELKSLDDYLDDILIVQKVDLERKISPTSNESIQATQCLCFESGCECEINVLAEELEAIAKKQYQMLQADERGRQALLSEIAAIKEKQEKRAALLKRRQQILDKEKQRSRDVASRPPPLPKSVRELLKKNDNEPKLNKPDVQMPDEFNVISIKPIKICCKNSENKENIKDSETFESRQKMQENWEKSEIGMKSKKRFFEALKKDRQKEDYSKIMKQIQTAELLNRQEMAKKISADNKGMPCSYPDKFQTASQTLISTDLQTARKQIDMEDATERIFKKTDTKEHVIEDIEGYQDHYEEKYKKIDSTYEAKMISCIPSFIKENYDYLLDDNSRFDGGKNFSGLDDSNSDILNQAYIGTPPGADELYGTEEIDKVVSHFDKLRSALETEIEDVVKPLLAASIEIPKKELKDQAVETESTKVPVEDKAVETDSPFKITTTSPSPTATFNFINSGVMAYKRSRPHLPILSTYDGMNVPDMHKRDVSYAVPMGSESEGPTVSWSSSSYCSLPSKHGTPTFSNRANSAQCDICIAERKKDQLKDNIIQESPSTPPVFNQDKCKNAAASTGKSQLSEYVQQLAEKYLSAKNTHQNEAIVKSFGDSVSSSNTVTIKPAFKKEVLKKSKFDVYNELDKSKKSDFQPETNILLQDKNKSCTSPLIIEKVVPVTKAGTIANASKIDSELIKNEKLQHDNKFKKKDNELQESPKEYSEYDYDYETKKAVRQFLSRDVSRIVLDDNANSIEKNSEKEAKQLFPAQTTVSTPYIYHELSTIQEIDSGLTASNLQLSQSKLSDTSESKEGNDSLPKEKINGSLESSGRLKMVSLLDSSDTEIAEFAKNIYFVPETEKKISHSLETPETVFRNSAINKPTSSKEHLSTPSFSTGSYSSISMSTPTLPSSSSSGSIPTPKSKVSELNTAQISTADMSNSCQEMEGRNSIVSGYISDLELSHVSSDAHLFGEDNKHTILSLSNNNDLDMQHKINSDRVYEKGNEHPVTSRCISDVEMPAVSDKSSPNTNNDIIFFALKSSNLKKVASNNNILLKQRQFLTQISSSKNNFRPMTPHSNVSSSSESDTIYFKKDQNPSSDKNFDPVIPYSSVSKPAEFIDEALKRNFKDDSPRNFKPMTPHSNVSSSSELTLYNSDNGCQNSNFTGHAKPNPLHSNVSSPKKLFSLAEKNVIEDSNIKHFKALTPHSNVSSPTSDVFSPNDKNRDYISSFENFKALTPYSNVSSPASDIFPPKDKNKGYTSALENFKALTPYSNVSSPADSVLPFENVPIDDGADFKNLKVENSAKTTQNESLIIRLDIATDSIRLNTVENKSSEAKHMSHISCNLTLDTLLSKLQSPTNYSLTIQDSRTEIISGSTDNRKYFDKPMNKAQERHRRLHLSSAKQYALACSSDFFIPSINKDLTLLNESISKDLSKASAENDTVVKKSETAFDSQANVFDDIKVDEKMKKEESASETATLEKKISNETDKEKLITKPKEILQAQVQVGNDRKQHSNAQGFSSDGSSSDNLSSTSSSTGINPSRVQYQSTPIKNMSELIQEPGILQEPSLTLIDLSCKMDATDIRKGPLTSVSSEELLYQEKDCLAKAGIQNECRTPISLSPQFLSSPDTPSMISFLQHEMSCHQARNNSVLFQSPASNNPVPQNFEENNPPKLREVKRSLFQRTGYKERTKRLWNNLEEVKKKNKAAERKKEIENNRRKAREFAKKLTPKQRK